HVAEERSRQADDVEVIALDLFYEACSAALDGVAAGAVSPFAELDVGGDLAVVPGAERDVRDRVADLLPGRTSEAQAGDDVVRPSREAAEHRASVVGVAGLAVDLAVEHDLGVDREHELARDGSRLADGVGAYDLDRVGAGRRLLLAVVGR